MDKRAFTLMELLVVIAIIAILAALLFPVFMRAKEAAKNAQDLNNIKQINTALQMYVGDYDDVCLPWYLDAAGPAGGPRFEEFFTWAQIMHPYIKSSYPFLPVTITSPRSIQPKGIYFSPLWSEEKWYSGANELGCWGPFFRTARSPIYWIHAHYGMGFGMFVLPSLSCTASRPYFRQGGGIPFPGQIMFMAEVQRPSETAIFSNGLTGVVGDGMGGQTLLTSFGCVAQKMLAGGGHLAFLDGHVKMIKGDSEQVLNTGDDGCVYKRYYTRDRG